MTSDIAKCAGNGCPIRETCDRFVRPAVDRQSWLDPRVDFRRVCIPPVGGGATFICHDYVAIPVQAHGGAVEEGDGA